MTVIVASAREAENQHLLRQSGADSTVVSSETAGRLLGIATMTPSVVEVIEDLKKANKNAKVSKDKLFIKNGDDSDKEECEGMWTISARETKRPRVRDGNGDLLEVDEIADVINPVSAKLTPEGLVALNVESTVDQRSAEDIAKDWLAANNLN